MAIFSSSLKSLMESSKFPSSQLPGIPPTPMDQLPRLFSSYPSASMVGLISQQDHQHNHYVPHSQHTPLVGAIHPGTALSISTTSGGHSSAHQLGPRSYCDSFIDDPQMVHNISAGAPPLQPPVPTTYPAPAGLSIFSHGSSLLNYLLPPPIGPDSAQLGTSSTTSTAWPFPHFPLPRPPD